MKEGSPIQDFASVRSFGDISVRETLHFWQYVKRDYSSGCLGFFEMGPACVEVFLPCT